MVGEGKTLAQPFGLLEQVAPVVLGDEVRRRILSNPRCEATSFPLLIPCCFSKLNPPAL